MYIVIPFTGRWIAISLFLFFLLRSYALLTNAIQMTEGETIPGIEALPVLVLHPISIELDGKKKGTASMNEEKKKNVRTG